MRVLARLCDEAFEIPLLGVRIGLDALVGLVPGIGDLIMAAASAWIVVEAHRLGAPRRVQLAMVANIVIDFLVGAVPLAGDLFDVAWKANVRNVALVERWLTGRAARTTRPR
jgi:hypothetical protein